MRVVGGECEDDEGRSFILHDGGDEGYFHVGDVGGSGEKLGGEAVNIFAEDSFIGADGLDLITHHIVAIQTLEGRGGVFRVLHGDDENAGEVVGGAGNH